MTQMPDSSRVWIFGADRALTSGEAEQLLQDVAAFLEQWKAHGAGVNAACELRYNQFLFVAADDSTAADPSGCSIDNMTRTVQRIAEKSGASFLNTPKVHMKLDGEVKTVERPAFKELAKRGEVNEETTVFDNSLISLGDVRQGKWELAAKDSWHKRLLESAVAA